MYLVVIGILSILLTLSRPLYPLLTSPQAVLAVVAAVTVLPAVAGLLLSRAVLHVLDERPDDPGRGQFRFNRGMSLIQAGVGLGQAAVLLCTGWMPLCEHVPGVGQWPVVPDLLTLVPLLLSIVLVWIMVYPADRAVRQIALEVYLFRGRPLRPVWRLGQYLLYNLRHQVLFVLIPMLLVLAISDLAVRYGDPIRRLTGQHYAPDLVIGVAAVLVAIVTPEILRHVWVTQRLPDGPLRDRLQGLCQRLRLRCRDILIWRSGGMIVNAAVMGVIAPLRYVLITDAMIEQLDDTKIEAVFGHEAGHVKHRHIECFLLFALISGCLITVFSINTPALSRVGQNMHWIALLGAILLLKWGFLFGWISRRFERQADVFGVRTLALTGLPCAQPCALHSPGENPGPTPRAAALCATAAHVFGDALHEVALLNGMQPEAPSWRHSSIASRSRFLQALARDPRQVQRFQRRVRVIQIVIVLTSVATALWAAQALRIWAFVGRLLWH